MFPSRHQWQRKEARYSKELHNSDVPLLVCEDFLRKRRCGQVDICTINFDSKSSKRIIKIYEIKSSHLPSVSQLNRLKKSQRLLSYLFHCDAKLIIYARRMSYL